MVRDQVLGDQLLIRVADNIVAPYQVGSLEFADTLRHAVGGRAGALPVQVDPHQRAL
jgi:hypothetical protein